MKDKNIITCSSILLLLLAITACSNPNSYESIVEKELATGVRNDTFFFGIYFGMPDEHFFKHGFFMNERGVFSQHSGEQKIQVDYMNEFKYPVECVFYPDFENDTVRGLSGHFYYTQWNAFNKEYNAVNLQQELVKIFEEWYGGRPFIKIPGNDPLTMTGDTYVKIDGNREIKFWNNPDNHKVEFRFMDLTYDKPK